MLSICPIFRAAPLTLQSVRTILWAFASERNALEPRTDLSSPKKRESCQLLNVSAPNRITSNNVHHYLQAQEHYTGHIFQCLYCKRYARQRGPSHSRATSIRGTTLASDPPVTFPSLMGFETLLGHFSDCPNAESKRQPCKKKCKNEHARRRNATYPQQLLPKYL